MDIPTFKEQGVDVELVNWRGLMAPGTVRENDKEALDAAIQEMARSPEWQAIVQERGWVDMYLPSDEFASFLAGEQTRIFQDDLKKSRRITYERGKKRPFQKKVWESIVNLLGPQL